MSDGGVGGSGQDLVNKLSSLVIYLGQIVVALQSMLPRITGTFTMAAAATKTVTDARINANGVVQIQATDATAGTLQGSAKSLYISSVASGSFTVSTASGGNAAGTETFQYFAFNPI